MMKLYGYWRSSASYRVRIALNLKSIEVEHISVNLKSGAQLEENFKDLNSQSLVPVLYLEDGTKLTQSLAIIDYLEGLYPRPALLPDDPVLRTRIRAAAQTIASDVAPIQNLRVLKYLKNPLDHEQDDVDQWARHWISKGLESLEGIAANNKDTQYLLTDEPGYFECVLVPQIYNARRFKVDMALFPNLGKIEAACMALPAFDKARPENQHDAPL